MKNIFKKEKKSDILKFLLLFILIFVYFLFVSHKYGSENGILITILSWSFFVFCTPIADAGFILDFPTRLITGIRMIHSEMIVWTFAILFNALILTFKKSLYNTNLFLRLFYLIITKPFPYWGIILLSAIGTFFSLYLGDEIFDVMHKKGKEHVKKTQILIKASVFLVLITLILALYDLLIHQLNLTIPLI